MGAGTADILGSVGSALVSGLGSLFGGSQQLAAQKSANKTNLQIARETNAQQMDMFNRGLEYNSFVNQRKMLEDAGYSPYALFQTTPSSSPSAPQLHTPQVIPEDAFGRAIGNAVGDMSSNLLNLSQAFKNNEDAIKQRIENRVLPYMLELQTKGYATQNDLLSIQKIISKATMQDTIDMAGLQKMLAEGNYQLTQQQITRAIIENAFEQEYGGRMRQKQIDSLAAKAFSDFQNGVLTSKEIEYLPTRIQVLLRQIKVDERNAKTGEREVGVKEFKAPSEIKQNYAMADNLGSVTALNRQDYDFLHRFGFSPKLEEALKNHSQYELNMAEKGNVKMVYQKLLKEIEKLDIETDFGRAEKITNLMRMLQTLMGGNIGQVKDFIF